jgi:hypothetical protein
MTRIRAAALSLAASLLILCFIAAQPPSNAQQALDLKTRYPKIEQMIPMRDGAGLFTSIYAPKDTSQKYPILLNRTPYTVAPYGPNNYKETFGPSPLFAKEGYIHSSRVILNVLK